jgi:hypothetical protein
LQKRAAVCGDRGEAETTTDSVLSGFPEFIQGGHRPILTPLYLFNPEGESMKKVDLSRRDFLKGTAVVTVATATVLTGKQVIENQTVESQIGDLEIETEKPKFSCMDFMKVQQKA